MEHLSEFRIAQTAIPISVHLRKMPVKLAVPDRLLITALVAGRCINR